MMKHLQSQPIGIFDSGIGGLTVAKALVDQLPHEHIIYFGDTAHLPYGDKTAAAIQSYAVKITDLLIQQHCKLILIACHTASSVAFDLAHEYAGSRAVVMNVIDPVVHHVQQTYKNKCIGLIGTKQTVNSNVYKKRIDALHCNITLKSQATSILASAIEEFHHKKVIDSIIEEYLSQDTLQGIEALILACTHYPVVKKNIAAYYHHKIDIIDPSDLIATAVKQRLETDNLINKNGSRGTKKFYVSGYTTSFIDHMRFFFNEALKLEYYPLWE